MNTGIITFGVIFGIWKGVPPIIKALNREKIRDEITVQVKDRFIGIDNELKEVRGDVYELKVKTDRHEKLFSIIARIETQLETLHETHRQVDTLTVQMAELTIHSEVFTSLAPHFREILPHLKILSKVMPVLEGYVREKVDSNQK